MQSVTNRLKQPSTYIGLAVLGQIFGVKELAAFADPAMMNGLLGILAGLGVVLNERAAPPAPPPIQ